MPNFTRNFIMLVGPQGVGKSTWKENNAGDAFIVCRDDIVIDVGRENGISITEMFLPRYRKLQDIVNLRVKARIAEAVRSGKDIVVDMMNINVQSRSHNLKIADQAETVSGESYKRIAVVFDSSGRESKIVKNVKRRAEMLGDKDIPADVVYAAINRFQMPTKAEGFDAIVMQDMSWLDTIGE
jgi:predicted kinase